MTDFIISRNFNKNVVTWNEALENLQYSKNNNYLIKFNPPGFYICTEAHKIEKVKLILKDLKAVTAHCYLNICSQDENLGNHKDDVDVWFWQCQGTTKWIINEEENLLYSGDLIFVKKNVYHNVLALEPRICISMSDEK